MARRGVAYGLHYLKAGEHRDRGGSTLLACDQLHEAGAGQTLAATIDQPIDLSA